MSRNVVAPIAAAIALAAAGSAQAATKTASFNVTATVANNCVISANPLALGAFDGTNDLAATSTVVVRCTNGTAYNVDLSRGASATFAARTMSNGTDTLVYNLFTDTTYTNSGATAPPAPSACPAPARASLPTATSRLPAACWPLPTPVRSALARTPTRSSPRSSTDR